MMNGTMRFECWIQAVAVTLALSVAPALANTITLSEAFDGNEPHMPVSDESCIDAGSLGYLDLGSVQVSSGGSYHVADVGNVLHFDEPASGIADIVVLIYEGAFDPADPASNRHAVVDTYSGAGVNLQPGIDYRLVVQHWCFDQAGAFVIVLSGSGTITGAGFSSRAENRGSWGSVPDTANFPGYGQSRYVEDGPRRVGRTGFYYFEDLYLYEVTNDFVLAIYEGNFDPGDPSDNLVALLDDADGVYLDGDTDYVLVPFDGWGEGGNWQYVLFPPGPMTLNPGLNAAWYNPATSGQGVFLDVAASPSFVFLAVFTFEEADPANPFQTQAVGSSDQRWLTAFGTPAQGMNAVDLHYENSTGGAFNRPNSEYEVDTDSDYGTGTLEAEDCDHLRLTYDLSGGLEGDMELIRAIPVLPEICAALVPAGPVVP